MKASVMVIITELSFISNRFQDQGTAQSRVNWPHVAVKKGISMETHEMGITSHTEFDFEGSKCPNPVKNKFEKLQIALQ